MSLPWHELQDDASSPKSFLDAKSWTNDAANELKLAYLDPSNEKHSLVVDGKVVRKAVDALIDLDQHFQDALIVDIITNTGISPRAVTIHGYLYRSTSADTRHLYLMDGQLALQGGPQKAESRRDGYRELVVRTLCQKTQMYLLPYLALFRAALVSILRDKKLYLDLADIYETQLIAVRRTGDGRVSDITAPWKTATEHYFGVNLTIIDKRQIDTGIHQKLFPELLRAVEPTKTAVEGQGDHGSRVCANYYGRSGNLCRGISTLDLNDYIDTSNTHHALMQTGPIKQNWPHHILEAMPFRREHYEELALDAASVLVPCYYNFGQLKEGDICTLVSQICSGLTFLFCHDVSGQF